MVNSYESISPDATLRTLRASSPVHYDEMANGWRVLRYEDVRRVLGKDDEFSSEMIPMEEVPAFMFMDDPKHGFYRALAEPGFRTIQNLAPAIQASVELRLKEMIDHGSGDLVTLADSVAARTVAKMLGVPEDDEKLFYQFLEEVERDFDGARLDLLGSGSQFAQYFIEQCARVRQNPTDNFLSQLIAVADQHSLTQRELNGLCVQILGAGIGTVRHLIVWFFACTTIEHHDEIRSDFGLLSRAIEEILRFRPPLSTAFRITKRPLVLGRQQIPAGALVLPSILSANHDEAVFADPDRIDIHRHPNPHMSLGLGVHSCIGSGLARLEARITIRTILDQLRDIRVPAPSALELISGINYGVKSLPITFAAGGAE